MTHVSFGWETREETGWFVILKLDMFKLDDKCDILYDVYPVERHDLAVTVVVPKSQTELENLKTCFCLL